MLRTICICSVILTISGRKYTLKQVIDSSAKNQLKSMDLPSAARKNVSAARDISRGKRRDCRARDSPSLPFAVSFVIVN